MNGRVFSFGGSGKPIAQILSLLAFGALLGLALIMGAVLIAVLFAVAAIFAAVLAVRVWWSRRRRRGIPPPDTAGYEWPDAAPEPEPKAKTRQKRLIEGEYEVLHDPDADESRRQR